MMGSPKNHGCTGGPTWLAQQRTESKLLVVPAGPGNKGGPLAAEALRRTEIGPLDEENAKLLDQVHPHSWVDPVAAPMYNMVAVGGGAGGLVTSAQASKRGGRVALIERNMLGGDCLNVGCVPSKALLACAHRYRLTKKAGDFGTKGTDALSLDFGAVMARMRSLRTDIAANDSQQRFAGDLGIDLFFGQAVFVGPDSISINGQTLHFRNACVATGGRAAVPPIPGLSESPFRTNATIFNLELAPRTLAIIGAGPIGCELAQAFAAFGTQVTLYDGASTVLPREDPDAAAEISKALEAEGVKLRLGVSILKVKPASEMRRLGDESAIVVTKGAEGAEEEAVEYELLLVCTGRRPNTEGLGLEQAGVVLEPHTGRVQVNDYLQTTNPLIYAVGDAALSSQFTHAAGESAQLVVRNALAGANERWSSLPVPACTYTHPELATVGRGATELLAVGYTEQPTHQSPTAEDRAVAASAAARGGAANLGQRCFHTFTMPFGGYDRPKAEGETSGFVRIQVDSAGGSILGATVVGSMAGELISHFTLAIQAKISVSELARMMVPYPTHAEAIKYCCHQWNINRWGGWVGLRETWQPRLQASLACDNAPLRLPPPPNLQAGNSTNSLIGLAKVPSSLSPREMQGAGLLGGGCAPATLFGFVAGCILGLTLGAVQKARL